MDVNALNEMLDELFPSIQAIETESAALLQFLKAKGLATDAELAPYLEQAPHASNTRWRAIRIRMRHLLAVALEQGDRGAPKGQERSKPAA